MEIATTSPFEQTVSFTGWNGELIIHSPNLFSGLVSGFKGTSGLDSLGFGRTEPFEVSDTILLKGLSLGAITGVTYNGSTTGGTLTLQEAGGAIAVDFLGDYTLNNFVLTAGPQALSTSPPSVAITYVTLPTISGTVTGQAVFAMTDTTTGMASTFAGTPYVGPVAGLQWEYITTTSDSLDIAATTPKGFIHTGSGNDAIDLSHAGGTNVVDGSTGSNFLVGGTGNDTFFVDDRSATAAIWSTGQWLSLRRRGNDMGGDAE